MPAPVDASPDNLLPSSLGPQIHELSLRSRHPTSHSSSAPLFSPTESTTATLRLSNHSARQSPTTKPPPRGAEPRDEAARRSEDKGRGHCRVVGRRGEEKEVPQSEMGEGHDETVRRKEKRSRRAWTTFSSQRASEGGSGQPRGRDARRKGSTSIEADDANTNTRGGRAGAACLSNQHFRPPSPLFPRDLPCCKPARSRW